jgi:hypothetical protein
MPRQEDQTRPILIALACSIYFQFMWTDRNKKFKQTTNLRSPQQYWFYCDNILTTKQKYSFHYTPQCEWWNQSKYALQGHEIQDAVTVVSAV